MYLIDTNIHAGYLLQNFETDDLSQMYNDFYKTIALTDRVIPDFILGEFETFTMQVVPSRYRLSAGDKQKLKQTVYEYLYRLTHNCVLITPDVSIVQKARDIYFDNFSTHYISFVDCLILATAENNNYSILTKDERIKMIAKGHSIIIAEP